MTLESLCHFLLIWILTVPGAVVFNWLRKRPAIVRDMKLWVVPGTVLAFTGWMIRVLF